MRYQRPMRAALATAGVLAASVVLGAVPAGAALQYPFLHELSGSSLPRGSMSNVYSVAPDDFVNDAFLGDSGTQFVYDFTYTGGYVAELHGSDTPEKNFGCNQTTVAANNSNGHVYVTLDCGANAVYVLDSSGKYLSELKGGAPFNPWGIAVDQANGDVWVNNVCGTLEEYNSSSEYVKAIKYEGCTNAIAVDDATGDLVVPNFDSNTVQIYSQSGTLLETWTGSVTPSKNFGYGWIGVAANNSNGDILVSDTSHEVVDVLTSSGAYIARISSSPKGSFGEPLGVGISQSTGDIFVADRFASAAYVYSPNTVVVPDVTTGTTSALTRASATVDGTVNPDKIAAKYWFEWGTEPSSLNHKTTVQEAGEAGTPVPVSAELSGLTRETTYFYRLVAENANGTNDGEIESFVTFGAIENLKTLPTTGVTATGATFHGELTPNGYATECWFEYQGGQMPEPAKTPKQSAGSASEVVKIDMPLSSLEPNSSYWDRFVCENKQFGSSGGEYLYFQTPEALPVVVSESTQDVARTRAVLVATVNPENSSVTYYFEYGTTTEYGYLTPEVPLSRYSAGEVAAKTFAGELKSDTVYHFRIVMKNGAGVQVGPDQTFTSGTLTPPVVTTGGASALSPNGATLEGLVTTEGLVTSYGFEISTNPNAFGPPTGLGSVGAGFSEAAATLVLHGLQPSTTYYYKIVGTNVDGSDEGEVHSFKTLAYPPDEIQVQVLPILTEPLAAWPQVSNAQYLKTLPPAPKPKRCRKGTVRRHGRCVAKKHKRGKRRKKKG